MRRLLVPVRLAMVMAMVAVVGATGARAQNFPGPSSPALARIYFYRLVESNDVTRWTAVFLNDEKLGSLGERSYFFRDVPPGTDKIGVSSDVPYPDQYRTVTVAANSTTFVRVFFVPGYGIQFQAGSMNAAPSFYQPSVFGNRLVDRATATRDMTGLAPAGN